MFSKPIPPDFVRIVQILHFSMGFWMVPLLFIIPVIMSEAPPEPAQYQMVNMLSIANAFFFVTSMFLVGSVLPRMARSKETAPSTADPDEAWQNRLVTYRRNHLIQLAVREGAVVFGLSTVLVASGNGVLHANPLYWLNSASAALFVLHLAITFPNEDRIRMEAEE